MSLIRRISTSISSSVDRAVSKVENHDAIINAALRDTQQAAVCNDLLLVLGGQLLDLRLVGLTHTNELPEIAFQHGAKFIQPSQ